MFVQAFDDMVATLGQQTEQPALQPALQTAPTWPPVNVSELHGVMASLNEMNAGLLQGQDFADMVASAKQQEAMQQDIERRDAYLRQFKKYGIQKRGHGHYGHTTNRSNHTTNRSEGRWERIPDTSHMAECQKILCGGTLDRPCHKVATWSLNNKHVFRCETCRRIA